MPLLFWCLACWGPAADPPQPLDIKTLIANLSSPRAEVRVEAATALARVRSTEKELVTALAAALADPQDAVRSAAIQALLQLAYRARFNGQKPPDQNRPTQLDPILPQLRKAILDSDRTVRLTTFQVLKQMEQDSRQQLLEGLDSKDDQQRILAAVNFLDVVVEPNLDGPDRKRALDIVQAALKHPDLALRLEAAIAQPKGSEAVAAVITEGFQSKQTPHRKAALAAYLRHGYTLAVDLQLVIDNLDNLDNSANEQFRGILTRQLQQTPNLELLPPLMKQADNPQVPLRTRLELVSLTKLLGPAAAPALLALMEKSEEVAVQNNALFAVMEIVRQHRDALPAVAAAVAKLWDRKGSGFKLLLVPALPQLGETGDKLLKAGLTDLDYALRMGCLRHLPARLEKEVMPLPILDEILHKAPPKVRMDAAVALQKFAGAGFDILMKRYPAEDDAGVKSRIVLVLGGLKKASPAKALETMLDAAASDNLYVRNTAISQLLLFTDKPEAVERLHKALLDPESIVRDTALKRLLEVPTAHEKALTTVRKSQDAALRRTLAQELQRQPRVKEPAAVKLAVAVLADLAADRKAPSLDRGDAIKALGKLGPAAITAVPVLRALEKEMDQFLIGPVRYSLQQIEGNRP